jgi:hypothetical protein
MARIAVGGFQHETSTFAPQRATWADFERTTLSRVFVHPALERRAPKNKIRTIARCTSPVSHVRNRRDLQPACSGLHPEPGIEQSQLDPDLASRVCAREGRPEGRCKGSKRPLRQGAFRQSEGPPAGHSQPTPPPPRAAAAAAGAARHPGPARPAQTLSAAAGAAASAAAGPPVRPRRAARHRFLPHGFGAGDRRGDRQSVRRHRPRRDRA